MGRYATRVLSAGWSVILDAVFARPEERAAVAAIAAKHGVTFDGLWLEAGLAIRRSRVAARSNDASDATPQVAERQETYDVGDMAWRRIAADETPDQILARILEALEKPL